MQPWFSRKNVLFGIVFASSEIWHHDRAKKIRLRYLREAGTGIVVICLISLLYFILAAPAGAEEAVASGLTILSLLIIATLAFAAANKRTRVFKSTLTPDSRLVFNKMIIDTSMNEKKIVLSSVWLLLLLPLFLVTLTVAMFGYDIMPENIPTHYSFTAVDAWSTKSWLVVMLPVIIEGLLVGIILACCLFTRRAPSSVRGNPEASPDAYRFRKLMVITLIIIGVLLELSFLLTEISFIWPISPLWFLLPSVIELILLCATFLMYFRYVRVKKPSGQILDDDHKWVLGLFYYNPSDPSVFVEKRVGIGYTVNFARPIAWIFMTGVLLFPILMMIISNI
jgi:uncharacterized membrane protein